MEKTYLTGSWVGTIIGALCWMEIYQIAFAVLGLISILFSIACSVLTIISKIKKIRADKKVTTEELEDLNQTIQEENEKIKNIIGGNHGQNK